MVPGTIIPARLAAAALVLASAILAACSVPVSVHTDEFDKVITVDGPSATLARLTRSNALYYLRSVVTKDQRRDVAHQLYAEFYYNYEGETERYRAARDDTGETLKLTRLDSVGCGLKAKCIATESIGVALSDEMLRRRVLTGYSVKVIARAGDEAILSLTPSMILKQLNMVDHIIDRDARELASDKPHLGINPIAATVRPYDGPPQGAIVVEVADGSPAAAAGVKPGDVFIRIDGHPIRVFSDVIGTLENLRHGQTVPLEFIRDGQPFNASVRL